MEQMSAKKASYLSFAILKYAKTEWKIRFAFIFIWNGQIVFVNKYWNSFVLTKIAKKKQERYGRALNWFCHQKRYVI